MQRQVTFNRILRAIAGINGEGKDVTIAALVEYTRLSRSTFAKPHIQELLAEYGYGSIDGVAVASKGKKAKRDEIIVEKNKQIAELRVENAKLERKRVF